jgi:hypothetical protein
MIEEVLNALLNWRAFYEPSEAAGEDARWTAAGTAALQTNRQR